MDETTVLVADDSGAVRTILRGHLSGLPVQIIEARDGESALTLAREHHIDLALLDVDMPGLSGFDVLAIMKSDPTMCDIPVLFLTARSNITDLVEGLSLGANDYLRKPWDADELRARVQVALRLKAERDELQQRNRELDRVSCTDPLTGLRNRRGLEHDLERLAPRLRGQAVGILAIDIDHFKLVNDRHGHAAGDSVLQAVSDRLAACLTSRHLLARWGGEEFLVVAQDATNATAQALAERLRRVVAYDAVRVGDGEEVRVTVSIGVSSGLLGEHSLIDAADTALYEAKRSGRDRVVVSAGI